MAFIENGDIGMLMEDSQLKELNHKLWYNEDGLMANIKLDSERSEYLRDCKAACDKIITLLAKCNDFGSKINHERIQNCIDKRRGEIKKVNDDRSDYLKHVDISMNYVRKWCNLYGWSGLLEYLELETKIFSKKCIKFRKRYVIDHQEGADGINKKDSVESDVQVLATANQVEIKQHHGIPEFARDIEEYVKYAINVGLKCAQNCVARRRWIGKIEMHIEMLKQVLEDKNDGNMQGMADHLSSYTKCMLEFAKNCQDGSIQADFTVYSTLLKKERIQFSDMAIRSKMNELGFVGEFDNLTDSQKFEVWCGIISESTSALFESKSCGVTSNLLLVEYIFGKGDATIREFAQPTFRGANMPNGVAIAREIVAKENKQTKCGLFYMSKEQ